MPVKFALYSSRLLYSEFLNIFLFPLESCGQLYEATQHILAMFINAIVEVSIMFFISFKHNLCGFQLFDFFLQFPGSNQN